MKGVCGCKNKMKLKEPMLKIQSRLFKNDGTHFIIHYTF
jgi:hypothetical protein